MIVGVAAVLFAGMAAYAVQQLTADQETASATSVQSGTALVQVVLPDEISETAQIGQRMYEANCATCHGANAAGRADLAPPLVHKIYEPSHHADESFQRAVALGVRAHHWSFGDMDPVPGLTRADVAMVVAYIRELQSANGIR